MWFDCVIIDKISADGTLDSYHIRARSGERLTTDKLEDIDPSFRAVNCEDMAGIRLYEDANVESRVLRSKLNNFALDSSGDIQLQLDHWGIPVTFGYYAVILPKGFRTRAVRVYDPYDKSENLEDKRAYRGLDVKWDSISDYSCAQLLMQSKRSTFSLGVIALLSPKNQPGEFSDKPGRLEVRFTEPRHNGHMWEPSFRSATTAVTAIAKKDDEAKFPDIKVGLSGPSISVNEVWRYGRHQWTRWRGKASGNSSS